MRFVKLNFLYYSHQSLYKRSSIALHLPRNTRKKNILSLAELHSTTPQHSVQYPEEGLDEDGIGWKLIKRLLI